MISNLTEEERADLLAFVDRQCVDRGCDDTLRHTWRWAVQKRVPPVQITRLLETLGRVRCDCELTTRLGRFGELEEDG